MIVDKDYFDNPIIPDYVLCKANKERIGTLKCTEKTADIKYKDLNEIHFTTYLYIDNEKNPYYEAVDIMKYILLPDVGFFFIADCDVQSEGTEYEYKEVTAKSYEGLLGQKYLETLIINMGSTGSIDGCQFYNLADKEHSLFHLVLSKCPEWKIGHIDPSLVALQRSFKIDRKDIYSFLMEDVSIAFGCIFLFDTLNNTINVYKEENVGEDTDIHVSYKNLLKNTNISCSIDDIKTCLTITGTDDLTVREVNLGQDRIYNFEVFNSLEYWSKGLYDSYNEWIVLYNANLPKYTSLLSQYQGYYTKINYLTYEKMPDAPSSTDWSLYGLNPLKEQLAVYEQKQTASMKAGHGNPESDFYESEYLPIYNSIAAINSQIEEVNIELTNLQNSQKEIGLQMNEIIELVSMDNNFTSEQLKELSSFIREDELNSDNFVVTDIMTEQERFEMLGQLLDFDKKELQKVATPQLSFSANIANIFAIPDFSTLYGKFDVGNYIWVALRDDYHVKARLLTMHINFYDATDFNVTFGNISPKAKTRYSDASLLINTINSVATSVSFNSSYWNDAYKKADNISQMLSDGLVAAGVKLKNADNSEVTMDNRGMFINTVSGEYAGKDSMFLGNASLLFTDDAWETVAMAVGRADVNGESRFGVFADFCIASYIAGSTIESSTIKTTKMITSEIESTSINNGNGTFTVDAEGNMVANNGKFKGEVSASTIIGSSINNGNGTFSVDENGKLITSDAYITKGEIGGAKIENNSIHSLNNNWHINSDGSATFKNVYLTGVQSGSNFGSLGFDGNNTFGNFTGNSYYGSSMSNPFSGTCVTHIETLSANHIKTNYLDAMNASIDRLEANDVSINGTLQAHTTDIQNLFANEAQLGDLIVNNTASINNLNAVDVDIKNQLTAMNANINDLYAKNVEVENKFVYNGKSASWTSIPYVWDAPTVEVVGADGENVKVIQDIYYRYMRVLAVEEDSPY